MENIELKNIDLEFLSYYFTPPVIMLLNNHNISNLEELFREIKNVTFLSKIRNFDCSIELIGTTRILKCEYLNEDPLISLDDETIVPDVLYELLGFSTKVRHSLLRSEFSENAKDFFEKMRKPHVESSLKRINHLGEKSINEIMHKVGVVFQYYDNKRKDLQNCSENEEDEIMNLLIKRLTELRAEKKRIDEETDLVLWEIQQRLAEPKKLELK